jgi:basic amino acid/polyamine antiporter, APA family
MNGLGPCLVKLTWRPQTPPMQSPDRDTWGERLPRRLGLWSAVAVLIGSTIGSGIFRVPATVAAHISEPGPFLLAWVVGGFIALCGALTYAELAAMLPRSGGVFAYILEGFGPLPAFLFGWSELAIIRASALGAISTIFAEYLGYFIDLSPTQVRLIAAAGIISVGLLNYYGVNVVAVLMNLTTGAKYGALAILGVLAFLVGQGSASHFTPFWTGGVGLSVMGTTLIAIMWTYDGWADLSFVGGEVKDPARNLPRALILGTSAIVVVYLLVNLAFMYLVPLPEMAQSALIASTAAERIPVFGGAGGAVVAGIVMVSCFGSLLASMMTGPRIFFAMADRGLFFKSIARVSPTRRSPSVAIALATVLGVIYVLLNDFQQLADKFILGIWPFYALAVGAVFVLRRTRPGVERPYRTLGYPITPLLFLLASLALIVNALVTDPINTGFTFGIILLGIPVYLAWRAVERGRTKA